MTLSRGDIVLILFPDSNLRTAKRRPALIIQADNLETSLHQVIVAMITSNLNRAGHPSRVTVPLLSPEGQRSGLKTDSVIATDNVATVLLNEIDRTLGSLGDMDGVDAALRHTFGLR
jgi:mRNA interferase MazF